MACSMPLPWASPLWSKGRTCQWPHRCGVGDEGREGGSSPLSPVSYAVLASALPVAAHQGGEARGRVRSGGRTQYWLIRGWSCGYTQVSDQNLHAAGPQQGEMQVLPEGPATCNMYLFCVLAVSPFRSAFPFLVPPPSARRSWRECRWE
jgi:hypothetical protein